MNKGTFRVEGSTILLGGYKPDERLVTFDSENVRIVKSLKLHFDDLNQAQNAIEIIPTINLLNGRRDAVIHSALWMYALQRCIGVLHAGEEEADAFSVCYLSRVRERH